MAMKVFLRFELQNNKSNPVFILEKQKKFQDVTIYKLLIHQERKDYSYLSDIGWSNRETWLDAKAKLSQADSNQVELRLQGDFNNLIKSKLNLKVSIKADEKLICEETSCIRDNNVQDIPTPPNPGILKPKSSSNTKWWLGFVFIFVLSAVFFISSVQRENERKALQNEKVKNVIYNYYAALGKADLETALSIRINPPKNFEADVKNNEYFRVNEINIFEIDINKAKVWVNVTGKNKDENIERPWQGFVLLETYQGEWRIIKVQRNKN
jgi:hypothetical protein